MINTTRKNFTIPKDIASDFDKKSLQLGINQSALISMLMETFLLKEYKVFENIIFLNNERAKTN